MNGFIAQMARHRLAANLLMFLVIIMGLIGLDRINTRFLPIFDLPVLVVTASWPGASAQDVQDNYGIALEDAIRPLDEVDSVNLTSREGGLSMTLTLKNRVSAKDGLDAVEAALSRVARPQGSDAAEVRQFNFPQPVADVLIYGSSDLAELLQQAQRAERSLASFGLNQVEILGIPDARLRLSTVTQNLLDLDISAAQLSQQLQQSNQNNPAGSTDSAISRQLRVLNLAADEQALAAQLLTQERLQDLGSLGEVDLAFDTDMGRLFYQGLPAVQLSISQADSEDTLATAERLRDWQASFADSLPDHLSLHLYNENWRFVESRVNILLESGLGGIILVLAVLFIFLNHRLAFWVAAGIPVAFLATIFFLELIGQTINLISMLGFLVALGIIVDDAIVVSEEAWHRMQDKGEDAETAAISAAQKMLPAILASTLTTIAAFLPLLLVTGQAGNFAQPIPIVVIMALLASLIECFLILPGHLAHSLKKMQNKPPSRLRAGFDRAMDGFRQKFVRRLVRLSLKNKASALALAVVSFMLAIALLIGGHVKFVFFPDIEVPQIQLFAEFSPETPEADIRQFMQAASAGLRQVEADTGEAFITTLLTTYNDGSPYRAKLFIELDGSKEKPINNALMISRWRALVERPQGLVALRFVEAQAGPGTRGLEVRLQAEDQADLNAASEWLKLQLRQDGRFVEVADNQPRGDDWWQVRPNSAASQAGLSTQALSNQLRAMINGTDISDVRLFDQARSLRLEVRHAADDWLSLQALPIWLANGEVRPLAAVADLELSQGQGQLNRLNGVLTTVVSAKTLSTDISLNAISSELADSLLTELPQKFAVQASLGGDAESQDDFVRDVQIGTLVGLLIIFGVLALVFESWRWPWAVIAIIPFGVAGAIYGHYLLGLDFSILSVYGIFGLSGIVINNSIVLIRKYAELRSEGLGIDEAMEEAAVRRFRAMLLTTTTTVLGLTPLLLETSFDALFLIPLAAGIASGLIYATVLVIFVVPSLVVGLEKIGKPVPVRTAASAAPQEP